MVKISALDRKLFRDLWQARGQAIAISLVIGAGIALFVLMLSTFDSLQLTERVYYDRYRFADVFASAKRAPLTLGGQIAAIPGVAQVETRVVVDVTLDVPDLVEPAVGRLISIPERRRPMLCDLFFREGRYIEPGRPDEVVASETFARIHGLGPGDTIGAIINGRRRELRIVGLALSPEFVYGIRGGELIPDDSRFGVLWMERRALAAAFNMEGGFNNVVLTLTRGASEPEVIARLDRLLAPYGGIGATPRALQPSHWYLQNELTQLQNMGAVMPFIFLGVAAFLLNVVLSRIISIEREQIGAMKAVGYRNRALAWHYTKWGLAVAVVGSALGIAAGAWLGAAMTRMYTEFFHFPVLQYRLTGEVALEAIAASLGAAILGALGAVGRAVRLPPAEAMRPEPPATYQVSLVERAGLRRLFSQPSRIIVRNLQRHPARAALSATGIALGGALLIVGAFSYDAVDVMLDTIFNVSQRFDVMVTFVEPRSSQARDELQRLPGVIDVEPFRSVPVRLSFGHRSRQTAILGVADDARLDRVVDGSGRTVALPPEGLMVSSTLADVLGARPGDAIMVEVLEGTRPVRQIPLVRVVDEFLGTNAYMNLDVLRRLMHEGTTMSGAYLSVDSAAGRALYQRLKSTPVVAGVMVKRATIDSFNKTISETMGSVRAIEILFATIIAFGVVYNSTRISLSERNRELATLRVIGFTRAEISYILLGEVAMITLVAVPLGLVVGYGLSAFAAHAFATELFRIPLVIETRTYAFSAATIVAATAISALVVRHRLDHLDLVAVLKMRE
jgi:putative ABC transport system permease protein